MPALWSTCSTNAAPCASRTAERFFPADKARLKQARHRSFEFGRSDGTDLEPWTIKTDGGFGYSMEPRQLDAAPQLANGPTDAGFSGDGTLEVWTIKNGGNGWSHPVHVHFEEGVILSRDGKTPPEWEKWARKDVYNRYTWDLAGTTSRAVGNSITITAATTGGPLNLGSAILSPMATGARWRLSVTTTGNGPSPSPMVTIHSAFGQAITVPITAR